MSVISKPENFSFEEMVEGLERSFVHRLTAAQIDAFADFSGDTNPLHLDPAFAHARGFQDRLAHGAIHAALVSRLVGLYLPGQNAIIQSTQLNFHRPTYPGVDLEVSGKVTRKLETLGAIQLTISVKQLGPSPLELVSGKVHLGFTQDAGKTAL